MKRLWSAPSFLPWFTKAKKRKKEREESTNESSNHATLPSPRKETREKMRVLWPAPRWQALRHCDPTGQSSPWSAEKDEPTPPNGKKEATLSTHPWLDFFRIMRSPPKSWELRGPSERAWSQRCGEVKSCPEKWAEAPRGWADQSGDWTAAHKASELRSCYCKIPDNILTKWLTS